MTTPNLSPDSIVVVARDQLSVDISDESVVLNMKNETYYGVQGVGTQIWHMMQKPTRVAELRDAILEEFDVEPARCERDLMELLAKLLAEGLIEVRDDSTT